VIAKLSTLVAASLIAAAALSAQQTGYLKTKVDPGRAGVFVDGKYVGPAGNFGASRKYALAPGEHKIKLVEPRYEEAEATVKIEAGKTAVLNQALKALPPAKGPFGSLHTEAADKYTAVYVNEHFMGHAGEFNNHCQALKLPAGEYTVRLDPPNGQPGQTQKIKIEADKTVTVK